MKRLAPEATLSILVSLLLASSMAGCKTEEKEPDCVPQPDAKPIKVEKKVERFGLGKVGQEKLRENEWCRACVMSRSNFASCQRVYSEEPGALEDKGPLKQKALDKACADAGYPKDECPRSAVISVICKGDAPPQGTKTAGAAVQDLFNALNPTAPEMAAPSKKPEEPDRAGETDKPTEPIIE